ncbi:MAG: cell division protein FtsA [Rhodobacteraceae bacterium]|nr:cell division protein FtsA [Paracoccaceae bacterium]
MGAQFRFHRTTRANLDTAFHNGALTVLDIGYSKISCAILELNASGRRPAGGEPQHMHSSGFRLIGHSLSRLENVEAERPASLSTLRGAVLDSLSRAYRMAGQAPAHVIASFSGKLLHSEVFNGEVALGNDPIGDRQVAQALTNCNLPLSGPNRRILHAQPIGFSVDHRAGFEDPRGERGNRLSVMLHYLDVDRRSFEQLVEVLLACRLKIAGIVDSAFSAGKAALVDNELQSGAVIVDIGAGTTNIAAFFLSQMLFCGSTEVGGARITADVCEAFGLSFSEAERLKVVHGGVSATYEDDRIIKPLPGRGSQRRGAAVGISRSDLIAVIRPRVEEMLEYVHETLKDRGWETGSSHQIVFTGGCCELPGFADLGRDMFGPTFRVGKPLQISGLPAVMTRPAFSSLVGLCVLVSKPPDELWDYDVDLDSMQGNASGKVGRLMSWVARNW